MFRYIFSATSLAGALIVLSPSMVKVFEYFLEVAGHESTTVSTSPGGGYVVIAYENIFESMIFSNCRSYIYVYHTSVVGLSRENGTLVYSAPCNVAGGDYIEFNWEQEKKLHVKLYFGGGFSEGRKMVFSSSYYAGGVQVVYDVY